MFAKSYIPGFSQRYAPFFVLVSNLSHWLKVAVFRMASHVRCHRCVYILWALIGLSGTNVATPFLSWSDREVALYCLMMKSKCLEVPNWLRSHMQLRLSQLK